MMSREYLAVGIIATVFGALLADASAGWRRRRHWRLAARRAAQGRKAELLESRRRDFCPAQSVSYANSDPLLIVEGRGAMLYDERGRGFLDTRNNVAHIGHCHPAVAQAVAAQVSVLNTNTRYLHPTVCELARRLLATFPPPLRDGVVFFVNSGSEANDLALRLARAANASRTHQTIVVEHAYHGHTIASLGLSPYKFEHPSFRGRGQPDWITQCPAPDTYRGPHRGDDAGARYAEYVEAACAAAGERGVCAFVIESGMSVAGVLLPPQGYLKRCYAAVRACGGVCIADEVQTGFGRLGSHWWAFEQQDVVPDIVTVGKRARCSCPLSPPPVFLFPTSGRTSPLAS
jgi:4-aminobutyrate aminotransferase-like enzyme